jgi:hypothetical protein
MPPTRRNLFQSHLSRRPASSTSTSGSSNSSSIPPQALPADPNNNHSLPEPPSLAPNLYPSDIASSSTTTTVVAGGTTTPPIDDGEIIARDKNGKFQIDIPVLPPIPLDEEDEEDEEGEEDIDDNGGGGAMEGIEEGRPSAGSGGSGSNNAGGSMSSELVGRDKESELTNSFSVWSKYSNMSF